MNELCLFAGAGGGILAGKLLGWRTVCAVEKDPYAASVLLARQNDGILPHFPIWDDVCTFDGKPWRGIVDVVSGGFPCQDISVAGSGKGINGERSGLWAEMFRIICEVRPRFVFVENSPMLTSRGLGRVLGDLAAMGFNARWGVLGANEVGAPHIRERIWIVANANDNRLREQIQQERELRGSVEADTGSHGALRPLANADSAWQLQQARGEQNKRDGIVDSSEIRNTLRQGRQERRFFAGGKSEERFAEPWQTFERADWWEAEPDVGRVADELAHGLDISGEIKL